MTNLLANNRAISIAELGADEIDLVGGGDTTTRMEVACKIDDNGNGECTVEITQKED